MIILVLFWRKRTTLNDSALLAAVFYGYLCWTLGGWLWVLPPLILFLTYNILSPQDVERNERPYTVQILLGVGTVGLFWLVLADITNSDQFYYPFLLSFAAQLTMIGLSRQLRASQDVPTSLLFARSIVISWLILFMPFVLLMDLGNSRWLYAIGGLIGIAVGAGVFMITQSGPEGYRNTTPRWLLQTLSGGLASVLGFAAIQVI
jgi:phytol kinase